MSLPVTSPGQSFVPFPNWILFFQVHVQLYEYKIPDFSIFCTLVLTWQS